MSVEQLFYLTKNRPCSINVTIEIMTNNGALDILDRILKLLYKFSKIIWNKKLPDI